MGDGSGRMATYNYLLGGVVGLSIHSRQGSLLRPRDLVELSLRSAVDDHVLCEKSSAEDRRSRMSRSSSMKE